MSKIIKENGYVYLVEVHDVYGRHKTVTNLGKDPEHKMWKKEIERINKKWDNS